MPITSDLGGKNYTLGRGRVYVDRFTPAQVAAGITAATRGEGERYIGNTPEFSTNSEGENLDHFDSDSGVRTKDDSVQLQLNRSGSFTTDNIDTQNLALLFLGEVGSVTQVSATAATYTITAAQRGRFYQVGATQSLPAGVRSISNVVVAKGAGFATTVTAAGNYEVDETLGRVYVLPGSADIPDDTDIQITYDLAATTREQIVSSSDSIYAAIRFVADNPRGVNRDFYLPLVKMSPNGDFNLKGDEWQSISFSMEVLKKSSNIEAMYIDGRPA